MGSGSNTLFITLILVLVAGNLQVSNNYSHTFPFVLFTKAQAQDLGTLDNSTDELPTDNSTNLDSLVTDNSTSQSNSSTQSNSAVPEFGSITTMILVILVGLTLVISTRSRLKFSKF